MLGLWFTAQQDARQQQIEQHRAQDATVQAYLDQMTQLILDRNLLEAEEGDSVYILAQAQTSTVIAQLDAEHNESVTRFLTDSGLVTDSGLAMTGESSPTLLKEIDLEGADLRGVPC